MMTKTKLTEPLSARSLATTLAIAFFTLSVVILVLNGALALYSNIQTNRDALSSKQQLIAQNAANTVSQFVQEKFSILETAVTLSNPVDGNSVTRKNMMDSLMARDPAFQQFALLDTRGMQLAQTGHLTLTLTDQFINQLKGDVLTQNYRRSQLYQPDLHR